MYMNNSPDKDKGFSPGIRSSNNRCFKCNGSIYFISKEALTPSGKPTKDPLTGKVIPLDPSSNEQHVCKPEDIEAFKQTDERKKRTEEWLSTQKSGQEVAGSSTSYTSSILDTSSNHEATNNAKANESFQEEPR